MCLRVYVFIRIIVLITFKCGEFPTFFLGRWRGKIVSCFRLHGVLLEREIKNYGVEGYRALIGCRRICSWTLACKIGAKVVLTQNLFCNFVWRYGRGLFSSKPMIKWFYHWIYRNDKSGTRKIFARSLHKRNIEYPWQDRELDSWRLFESSTAHLNDINFWARIILDTLYRFQRYS